MFFRRYKPVFILLAILILMQLVFSLTGTAYYLTQLIMSAYYAMVVMGLCLLMGYAGQISLGHAGFFAIGGYTSAFLTTVNLAAWQGQGLIKFLSGIFVLSWRQDLYGNEILAFAPWFAFLVALLLAAGTALLIGIPVLRLKGHYLAMATLGFGMIIQTIVIGSGFLGEADGIQGVPPFRLLGLLPVTGKTSLRITNYYVAWTIVLLGLLLAINLIHSRVGRAMRAIHNSEDAARAAGVHTAGYKLKIFVLSALFSAIGGIFLTHYNGGIGPSETSVIKSVRYVAIVAVGGMDNIIGALVMGVILNFLSLRGLFGSYDDVVFGLILIGMMLFSPAGILKSRMLTQWLTLLKTKLIFKFRQKRKNG